MNSHALHFVALGIFAAFALLYYFLPLAFRKIYTQIKEYNRNQLDQKKRTLGISLIAIFGGVASLWSLAAGVAFGFKGIRDCELDSMAGGLSLLVAGMIGGYLVGGIWRMKRLAGRIILALVLSCLIGLLILLLSIIFIGTIGADEVLIIIFTIAICLMITPVVYSLIKNLPRMH